MRVVHMFLTKVQGYSDTLGSVPRQTRQFSTVALEITIFRDVPVGRESRYLPAFQYNLARKLQACSPAGVAFVPIRSMQILAILDAEEFVFVDSQHNQLALLAWQAFQPKLRDSLADRVPFEACFYRADAAEMQLRLQPEFFNAMQVLAQRESVVGPARVLKFVRPAGRTGPDAS